MLQRLKHYAQTHVPQVFDITRGRIIWTLFTLFGFKVSLYLQFRSDDLDCRPGKNLWAYVFEGRLLEHREAVFCPRNGEDFYHVIQGGIGWTVTSRSAPLFIRYRPGDVHRIELYEAKITTDKIIDFNEWATAEQFVRDAELRIWAITVTWG